MIRVLKMDNRVCSPQSPTRILALMEAYSVTGPAKNLLTVARGLNELEAPACSIRVMTFSREGVSNAFVDACEKARVALDVLRERHAYDLRMVQTLRARILKYKPDIIQTHNSKSHFLIRACGLNRTFRWIAFNHGYTAEDLKMRLYNQLDRWSLRGAHRVVVVCDAFGAALRRWGIPGERIAVRHNCVSPLALVGSDTVHRLRAELRIPAGVKVLLTVGRLSPEKGHRDLLGAIAELKKRRAPVFRVVMLGAGPEFERLQEMSSKLDIADVVIFAGTTRDVAPYYALADVFILPSLSEGSPNALLEAMISGRPVIATSVGGVPEIIQHGVNGLLVPSGSVIAMAETIAEMMRDDGRRKVLGECARESAEREYSRQAYIDWMVKLYEGAVSRGAPVVVTERHPNGHAA